MTQVVVPLSAADPAVLLADSARAATAGADLVEWRIDTCLRLGAKAADLVSAIARSPLPVVWTMRHASERGDWSGPAADRETLCAQADAGGAAWIDLELAQAGTWRPKKAKLILSYHDFDGMGTDLPGRIRAMRAAGGLPKVAVTPKDAADLDVLRTLVVERQGEVIVLGMGEHGLPSRLLAGVWGGFLTFARLDGQAGSAPGQPAVGDLVGLYRLRRQQPGWKTFGVIGSPIAHSLSPHIHNAALAHDGVQAVYVPFRVEDATAFWGACGRWIDGLSITIPHKHALLGSVDRLDPLARAIGAMNTISRDGTATVGGNTDAAAIISCVTGAAGELGGKTVLCLGAGGVGRAIAHALASKGASVVVTNRTADRARELATEVRGRAVDAKEALAVPYDVLVNGTSLGMGKPDESPWPADRHRPGSVVFDTVYTPLETRLLKDASAAGARIVHGLDMFIHQAAEQYRRFTGRQARTGIMRAAALARLQAKG